VPTSPQASEQELRDRERVLALLRIHGRQATSFQILEPGYDYFFHGDQGCVAYTDTGRAWVAAGAPVAPEGLEREVALGFIGAAQIARREARFFAVDEGFAKRTGLHATHIGEQPIWDPAEWQDTLRDSRSLREQLRRARAKGVTGRVVPAEEITDEQGRVRRGVDDLIAHWLASRPMSEMKFMVLVHPFSFPKERRYVVAEQDGQVVGFAAAVPVYAQGGWFLEDLLRLPDAPNGTAELLVDAVMRQLDDEGCRYATLGLAPLAGEVNTVLRLTRDYTAALYNFGGVRAFKAKLRPHSWEPLYLAWPRGRLGLLAMRDALAAFAPGGMIRFGLNTLVHERSLATFVLGLLLVPWTFAVGMVDTEHWFPSATVQQAWVVFDLLLIGLLFALVQRWRSWLAGVLAALTTADAALTLYQVATHNVARVSEPWEWLVLGIGVSGPMIAATFLWATRIVAVRSKLPVARRAVAG